MLFPKPKPKKTTIADRQPNKGSDGWLGTPVLIPGEDATAFEQFADRIRAALKPSNAIEEIYVDDAIFHGWEVRRWRRAKGGLLWASSPAAVKRVLERICVKPLPRPWRRDGRSATRRRSPRLRR